MGQAENSRPASRSHAPIHREFVDQAVFAFVHRRCSYLHHGGAFEEAVRAAVNLRNRHPRRKAHICVGMRPISYSTNIASLPTYTLATLHWLWDLQIKHCSGCETYGMSSYLFTPLARLTDASSQRTRLSVNIHVPLAQVAQLRDPFEFCRTTLGCHIAVRLFSLNSRRRTLSHHESAPVDMSSN